MISKSRYCSCEYFWCSVLCTSLCTSCHYRRWMLPWSMVFNYDCHYMPSSVCQRRFSFSWTEEVWVCHPSGTRQHETRTFQGVPDSAFWLLGGVIPVLVPTARGMNSLVPSRWVDLKLMNFSWCNCKMMMYNEDVNDSIWCRTCNKCLGPELITTHSIRETICTIWIWMIWYVFVYKRICQIFTYILQPSLFCEYMSVQFGS